MFASEPPRNAREPAPFAGRVVFVICGVIALMLAVIFGARLLSDRPLAPLSIALPLISLAWLALLGLQVRRYRAPAEAAPLRSERPSKRPPRFDPSSGARSDRPSDSGRHVNA